MDLIARKRRAQRVVLLAALVGSACASLSGAFAALAVTPAPGFHAGIAN